MFGSASHAHRRFCRRMSVRRPTPCPDVPRIHCRCLMQPKLRYTPTVVFSCFISFHKQERFLMFGSASRAHRRFCRRVSVRRLAPCPDVPRIHRRCLMQPKLRYTPTVVFSCFISFPMIGTFSCATPRSRLRGTQKFHLAFHGCSIILATFAWDVKGMPPLLPATLNQDKSGVSENGGLTRTPAHAMFMVWAISIYPLT